MPDDPIDTPAPPPEAAPPTAYLAAIGARGGRANSPAQQAVRARGYGKLTEEQRAEIVRRYEAGEIARVLAAEYGVTKHAIDKIVRKVRGRSYSKLSPEQRAEIVRRREAGEPTKALAAEYGVTGDAINKIARKARTMAAEAAESEDAK